MRPALCGLHRCVVVWSSCELPEACGSCAACWGVVACGGGFGCESVEWVAKSVVGVTLCGFDVGGWGCVGLCFVAAALVVGLWWLPCLVVVPFWGVVVGCGVLFVNSIVCLFFMPVFCF